MAEYSISYASVTPVWIRYSGIKVILFQNKLLHFQSLGQWAWAQESYPSELCCHQVAAGKQEKLKDKEEARVWGQEGFGDRPYFNTLRTMVNFLLVWSQRNPRQDNQELGGSIWRGRGDRQNITAARILYL